MKRKDPKIDMPLEQVEENVYINEYTGAVYVYANEAELESPEFNELIQKYYASRGGDVYMVIDGKLLEDPICGGALQKVGENQFVGEYSGANYMMTKGEVLQLKDPICGAELIIQEDGRFYSEVLDKFFTLEEVSDGSMKFFPTYLPYEGMEHINAKLIDGKLVGENGIEFPVDENGYIDLPMDDKLTTQEEIDASIQKKHEIADKAIEELDAKTANEIEKIQIDCQNEISQKHERFEQWREAFEIAVDREAIAIKIKAILEVAQMKGDIIDISELPQMPEMPEDIPEEIVAQAMEDAKKIFQKDGERLKFENVQDATESITKTEGEEAIDDLGQGLDITLTEPNIEKEDNEQEL